MSRPTVATLIDALSDERLVTGIGRAQPTGGRAAVQFGVNPLAAVAIGIDLGATKIAGALADLDGRILVEHIVPTPNRAGVSVLDAVVSLAHLLAAEAEFEWSAVAHVAFGVPFSVAEDGVITNGSNLTGLDGINLMETLRGLLDVPMTIDNDVNQAALGELRSGLGRETRSFVFVAVGTGLGAGIVVDGRLLRGTRGAAGELAYMPMIGESRRRRRGTPLEAAVTQRGYRDALRRELEAAPDTKLTAKSSVPDVLDAAGSGDPVAQRIVADRASILADTIIALSAVVDPQLIVLGGGIGSHPILVSATAHAVSRLAPWPLPVVASALGPRAGLLGGLALAVAEARSSLGLSSGEFNAS